MKNASQFFMENNKGGVMYLCQYPSSRLKLVTFVDASEIEKAFQNNEVF